MFISSKLLLKSVKLFRQTISNMANHNKGH